MPVRRIELPDDNWAEIRENLKGKDRTAVHEAISFTIQDGAQKTNAAVADYMQHALIASVITAWSLPQPIPAVEGGVDAVAELELDYLDPLVEATAPLLKRVNAKIPN